MKKYVYWVNASAYFKNNNGYDTSVDASIKYESNHKFNSESINECAVLIKKNIESTYKCYSSPSIVINFFGRLYD